jgi:transposase InsO family protein
MDGDDAPNEDEPADMVDPNGQTGGPEDELANDPMDVANEAVTEAQEGLDGPGDEPDPATTEDAPLCCADMKVWIGQYTQEERERDGYSWNPAGLRVDVQGSILIPDAAKGEVFRRLHRVYHPGGEGLVRLLGLWGLHAKGQREAAAEAARACGVCRVAKPAQGKATPIWMGDRPMSIVGLDFSHPRQNVILLLGRDHFSGWVECVRVREETARVVITFLRHWVSRNGLMDAVWTDNGPAFRAAELREFLAGHCVAHHRTPVYRSEANGQVERAHRSVQEAMRCGMNEGKTLEVALLDAVAKLNRAGTSPGTGVGVWQSKHCYGERVPTYVPAEAGDSGGDTRYKVGDHVMVRYRGPDALRPLYVDEGHVVARVMGSDTYWLEPAGDGPVRGADLRMVE